MSTLKHLIILLCLLLLSSCKSNRSAQLEDAHLNPVETLDNIVCHQIYSTIFDQLDLQTKQYAYHLANAIRIGEDLAYDRRVPQGYVLKRLFTNLAQAMDSGEVPYHQPLMRYIRKFWAYQGNYDPRSNRKIIPDLSSSDFLAILHKHPSLYADLLTESELNDLLPLIFTPDLPMPNADTMKSSSSAPDLFPARMSDVITGVITELESAFAYAPTRSRPALSALIQFMHTGSPEDFERHRLLWILDTSRVTYVIDFDQPHEQSSFLGIFGGMVLLRTTESHDKYELLYVSGSYASPVQRSFTLSHTDSVSVRLSNVGGDALINPRFHLRQNRMGGIKDLLLTYPRTWLSQFLSPTPPNPQ